MLLLIISSFSYPTSILGLQDLKPLNIVLLEPDTNDLTSILDQDKYTSYQDSLEDQNYVPGIEEIALILSTKVKNFWFSQLSDSQIVEVTLHSENFVTARGAKSITSSDMCLVPPMVSLRHSKFIFGPNFGPNRSQTVGLIGQKPTKKNIIKPMTFCHSFLVSNKFSA